MPGVPQDLAVAEVRSFRWGLDPDERRELHRPVGTLARTLPPTVLRSSPQAGDGLDLLAGQAELSTDSPGWSCNGRTPIPIRLGRWIRSWEVASTAFTPRSTVPFAAHPRDDPESYSAHR